MVRWFWTFVGVFLLLWLLLQLGLVPAPLTPIVASFLAVVGSLACPITLLLLLWAPGLFRETSEGISRFFSRIGARRREEEDLHRKIAHLDKAHHMLQLGSTLLRQGRVRKAAEWLQRAVEKEPDLLEAQYRLALCRYELGDYPAAAELLEAVHATKPQHDYGLADLRLAQSQQNLGNRERAEEVYETLLRFYPGQPEGSYHYAVLKAEQNETERARQLMQDVIFSVRHSPRFQRRRNRHWLLKAKWWLLRNRAA
jgi:tetratricopeptide (TPR) repeat protein